MNGSAKKWEVIPKELVSLGDGNYWLPGNPSEIFINISDIYPNGLWNDDIRVFGTEKQTLDIKIEYDCLVEENENKDVWIAIYRVGRPEPLWTDSIKFDVYDTSLTIKAEMESEPGLHFIMLNHTGLENSIIEDERLQKNTVQSPYGVRYDFRVEPDGNGLIHPDVSEIQFMPRSLAEWKKKVKEQYLDSITLDAQLTFQKKIDLTDNYLQIEVFDEALNWIAWSGYAGVEGHVKIMGFYPIIDSMYQFVVLHNQTPFLFGEFACREGVCSIGRLEKWSDDNILKEVLASRSHAKELEFFPTSYGRRLQLLDDVQDRIDDDSVLEGDCLEKLLAEFD